MAIAAAFHDTGTWRPRPFRLDHAEQIHMVQLSALAPVVLAVRSQELTGRMGRIDRTKHDEDVAEHVIAGVRLDRGPYGHWHERTYTADDRSQPDRRAVERRQWPR
jgi:hypothetical protein